jgi:hypothetical protein
MKYDGLIGRYDTEVVKGLSVWSEFMPHYADAGRKLPRFRRGNN